MMIGAARHQTLKAAGLERRHMGMAESGKYPQLLVLVRHGQSMRNKVKPNRGPWPDNRDAGAVSKLLDHEVPLTELGRSQATVLGPFLRKRFGVFDKVYDSGYRRAVETRELALAGGYAAGEIAAMRIRSELLLREREAGLMHGATQAMFDAEPLYAACLAAMERDPFLKRYISGESIADVVDRLRQFRSLVLENQSGRKVLVFCHEVVMKAFQILLLRMDVTSATAFCREASVANTAVHAYAHEGGCWRFTAHQPPAADGGPGATQ